MSDTADTPAEEAAVAEMVAWARGQGIEEPVGDGLLAEASAINNGGLEAQLRRLFDKWGSVEQVKSLLADA